MDVATILAILGGIFGLVGIAGGISGYFKGSRGDKVIQLQGLEIESIRRTLSDRDKEVATLKDAGIAKDVTITELQKHNSYLQKLAQGSPQLKKLTSAIENNTKIINKFMSGEATNE